MGRGQATAMRPRHEEPRRRPRVDGDGRAAGHAHAEQDGIARERHVNYGLRSVLRDSVFRHPFLYLRTCLDHLFALRIRISY